MGILTRPLLRPQQRWDLEDFNVALSALRADSHFYTGAFLANKSYILQGFTISQTYIGQPTAQISLANSTLINPDNTGDISWWTAPSSPTPITLPTGVGGLQAGRNYVELVVNAVDGTPLQRAFWDPSANSGAGIEFTQEVDTVTELFVNVSINQTGFSIGDTNKIRGYIIDLDNSLNIRGIRDKRNLFFRLGTPDNLDQQFIWASRSEPATTLVFGTPSGVPFVAGETVTFASGATAVVVTGGTNNLQVFNFSTDGFLPGDLVSGNTSSATAILQSYYEAQSGADKDIHSYHDMFDALMNEVRVVKGTRFWYQIGPAVSLPSLLNYVNTIMAPVSNGARFYWSGSALSITDNATAGQTAGDTIAALRRPGYSGNVLLARQDGTGGSGTLTIPDGSILFVTMPAPGSSVTYTGQGSNANNYQVIDIASFVPTDLNRILAYREGTKLVIPGMGELKPTEAVDVSGEISKEILAFIGATDETSTNPQYTTTPSTQLSNQFSSSNSLTQAISINAANINDMAAAILQPYDELLTVVASGASGSHQTNPVSSGTTLTLPLDTRNSNTQKKYTVNQGGLMLFLNGQHLIVNEDYLELGGSGNLSSTIQILQNLVAGDELEFRVLVPQFFGTVGQDQAFFVNYITGQNGTDVPTGHLYNMGTDRLQIWRNGLAMNRTSSVGDVVDRYLENTSNDVTTSQAANSTDVFVMVNHTAPSPNMTLLTGLTSTVITVPTYTMGDGSLRIFRNGVLLSTNVSADPTIKYAETSTTTITLSTAALITDVFKVYRSGMAPTWRTSITGISGTNVSTGSSFTPGSNHLLAFRNGLLMNNSVVLGQPVEQYQQSGSNAITLQVAATSSDLFEFINI